MGSLRCKSKPEGLERTNQGAQGFGAHYEQVVTAISMQTNKKLEFDEQLHIAGSTQTNNQLGPLNRITLLTTSNLQCASLSSQISSWLRIMKCVCGGLSHKRAQICEYYKWQKYCDEVSCILNQLAEGSHLWSRRRSDAAFITRSNSGRWHQKLRINVVIIRWIQQLKKIITGQNKNL